MRLTARAGALAFWQLGKLTDNKVFSRLKSGSAIEVLSARVVLRRTPGLSTFAEHSTGPVAGCGEGRWRA